MIQKVTGPAFVYRDNTKRFIGVKFSVRERDLGSAIAEAQQQVAGGVQLPDGYSISSESQKPLVIIIIGGLVSATLFTLLVFPIFYYWAVRRKHSGL